MSTISTIQRILNILEKNITKLNPTLDYNRIIRALELLGLAIHSYKGNNEDWLYLNEFTYSPDSFIVGGYWHLTEWHNGQWSNSYRALCSLGTVFNPGMADGPESETLESEVYQLLDQLAEETNNIKV